MKSLLVLALLTLGTVGRSVADEDAMNGLTAAEKAAGWKLLFNGSDLSGWHNFKKEGVRAGWQVRDGTLACVDPHNAGDIALQGDHGQVAFRNIRIRPIAAK
jgi:hypothetical protein